MGSAMVTLWTLASIPTILHNQNILDWFTFPLHTLSSSTLPLQKIRRQGASCSPLEPLAPSLTSTVNENHLLRRLGQPPSIVAPLPTLEPFPFSKTVAPLWVITVNSFRPESPFILRSQSILGVANVNPRSNRFLIGTYPFVLPHAKTLYRSA